MFCTSVGWFICIFLAVVIAANNSNSGFVTESNLGITVNRLRTNNPELSTIERVKEVEHSTVIDLASLLDAGDGAVVTLVAGETRLVAHRAVLAARSPVFAAMFGGGTPEAGSGQITITDVEGPVLRQLLAYTYSLQAPQLPGMAPQLLAASDKYGVLDLKADCERQVAMQLCVETAAATAVLAVRHSSTRLRQAAVTYIKANLLHVVGTQGWADAWRYQPEDMVKVIRLLSDQPAETSTGGGRTTPGAQLDSDDLWTPATAAAPSALHPATTPGDGTVSHVSTLATGDSRTTPATQLQSHHSGHDRAPAAAALSTVPQPTPSPDDAKISHLQNLSGEEKMRRLIEAAVLGEVEDLRSLLAAGAELEARDGANRTALHWAAARGHTLAVRCLLESGANVDARTSIGETPLHLAAGNGHVAAVRLLLGSSANPDPRNVYERTPLHYAAYRGQTEVAAALLQAGADRGIRSSRGETPLDDARSRNHQELIQLLTSS